MSKTQKSVHSQNRIAVTFKIHSIELPQHFRNDNPKRLKNSFKLFVSFLKVPTLLVKKPSLLMVQKPKYDFSPFKRYVGIGICTYN